MKTTSCPYCGVASLSGSAKYPASLRERGTGRLHGEVCERWPGARPGRDYTPLPVPEPTFPDDGEVTTHEEGAIEVPPDESASEYQSEAPALIGGNGDDDETARLLVSLLRRPSMSEARVREIVESAVSELELPEPKSVRIRIPDKPDVEIESAHHLLPRLVQYAACRLNVMLVGPAGSGKTTAGHQCAQSLSLDYVEQGMGPATSQWDLLGYLSPDGRYVPGKLRRPYEHGGVYFVDEIDCSNPSALVTINSAIANGHCAFPDAMVAKHPDFVLVASANTYGRGADRLYVGRQQLDAATLDRFAVIDWDYDEVAEIQWAGKDQQDWTRYVQRCRHRAADLKLRVVISPRASIMGATLLRADRPREEVESAVLWRGISADDRSKIKAGL